MTRLFLRIYDILRCRRPLMWSMLAATVLIAVAASTRIRLKEDISDFLPADKENQDIVWAFSHIGGNNRAVICITPSDSADTDRYLLMDAVDTLERKILETVPEDCLGKVTARADVDVISEVTGFIVDNLPLYLSDEDYSRLDSLLASGSLDSEMAAARGAALSPGGSLVRSIVVKDPLLLSVNRLRELQSFRPDSSFETEDDYLFTKEGDALMILDLPFPSSDTKSAGRFIEALDDAVSATERIFEGRIKAEPLGSTFIAFTNSSQIKRDSVISIIISVALIALLLVSFFRKGRSILLVGVTILYGFLTAFGAMALIKGSMSLIVIGMGAVIIGIAANYPLHFLTHISRGYTPRQSLEDIVLPLTTGNITTVGAFLSLLFIASPAMRDLGLFAALLLAFTIIFTLVFLPHLAPQNGNGEGGERAWKSMPELRLGSSRIALVVIVAGTILLSFFDDKVKFDSNLHNINYMTERQKDGMEKMLRLSQGGANVAYVVVPGKDIDEALDNYLSLAPRIDSLSSIDCSVKVSAIHDFVLSKSEQRHRIGRWNSFVADNGTRLVEMVNRSAMKAGFVDGAFSPFEEMVSREFSPSDVSLFSPIYDNVAAGMLIFDENRCAVASTVTSSANVTAQAASSLTGSGASVFDASTMTTNMVASLSREFDTVLYLCAFVVFLLLLVSFGRIELAGLAFLPLTIGWVWILGLMALLGIDFNIINIILATFIFGMGDDYTIFMTEGVMYEYAYGRKMLHTYQSTIILSALIMFAGMGSLIVARHPAMLSLSYVTVIGMFCVVAMAVILPPFIFRWLTYKQGARRKEPVTLVNFCATVAAFLFFVVFSLLITAAGFLLITLTFNSKKGKYLYHRLLCCVSRFVFNNVFFTRHTVECEETFEKPAVVVANHQSHLDLMALLMLTPKMVVVTNRWAWNNPFYALLIRYAGFCPVENVLTDDLSCISDRVGEGYSVLVFPEGTRTPDGRIGRFHKGAFHIAEKFGLDIVPVVLHGINDVLPKQDLLLRKGHMTVKVLPRIIPQDTSYGSAYQERAKLVRKMMAETLDAVAAVRETPEYFRNRVLHNYIYKGADVARSVRRSLDANRNFASLAGQLPAGGRVLFREPDYGEASLVCALSRRDVVIDALISDAMKRSLAECCAAVPENLHYCGSVPEGVEYDLTVNFNDAGYSLTGDRI